MTRPGGPRVGFVANGDLSQYRRFRLTKALREHGRRIRVERDALVKIRKDLARRVEDTDRGLRAIDEAIAALNGASRNDWQRALRPEAAE